MSGWSLGIDFGTSYTVAAVDADGVTRMIDVESNGSDRMPSCVFLTESGELLVGSAAQHQAVFAPERYEPTPKRSLGEGEILLGDRLVEVADLAAAVLRRVYTEACRQHGERTPDQLRLTYPADWGDTRRAILSDACQRGGLPAAELVPEPVAAAVRIALQVTPPGRRIAVYDFGGGTFDAAVLLRTEAGFEVAGPPSGRDPLGGEDIDQRVIGHLGELLSVDHAEQWAKLMDPPDVQWRRHSSDLRGEVRRAKETLSEVNACQLWVPGIERDVQLTRGELDGLIAPDIDSTVDALEGALSDAGVTANDLAGLYLVGGSSRIPLVADTLWRRLGVRPAVQDNPKSVVAAGAAGWARRAAIPAPAAAVPPPPASPPAPSEAAAAPTGPPPAAPAAKAAPAAPGAGDDVALDGALTVRPRLQMSCTPEDWPGGYRCVAQFVLDLAGPRPLTLRTRDEPARGLSAPDLARNGRAARVARTPGFDDHGAQPATVAGQGSGIERRFAMTSAGERIEMVEQYLVVDGRALVIACPLAARAVADAAVLGEAPDDPRTLFHSRLLLQCPRGWSAAESVTLGRNGTKHTVTAERFLAPAAGGVEAWRERQLDAALSKHAARIASRVQAKLFERVPGEIVSVVWRDSGTPMVTKLGLAGSDREGLAVSISLPHTEQRLFTRLAQHARLRQGAGAAATVAR